MATTLQPPANSLMSFISHGHSDVGFIREKNEDAFLNRPDIGVFAVADGVGGLPYGALASKLAVQNFEAFATSPSFFENLDNFKKTFFDIHKNILENGLIVGGQNGIGTTFSGIKILDGRFLFSHVGDSSILHFRKSEGISEVTKCHTLAAELIAKHGPESAKDMPEHYAHTLTRCMGQDIDFDVDVGEVKVGSSDKIIICSDGVTNMVELAEMEQMCRELEPEQLVHSLIDLANQNGGSDNSTVVCVQIP
jgi:serine/threonine protein phosphatase PrpC